MYVYTYICVYNKTINTIRLLYCILYQTTRTMYVYTYICVYNKTINTIRLLYCILYQTTRTMYVYTYTCVYNKTIKVRQIDSSLSSSLLKYSMREGGHFSLFIYIEMPLLSSACIVVLLDHCNKTSVQTM